MKTAMDDFLRNLIEIGKVKLRETIIDAVDQTLGNGTMKRSGRTGSRKRLSLPSNNRSKRSSAQTKFSGAIEMVQDQEGVYKVPGGKKIGQH